VSGHSTDQQVVAQFKSISLVKGVSPSWGVPAASPGSLGPRSPKEGAVLGRWPWSRHPDLQEQGCTRGPDAALHVHHPAVLGRLHKRGRRWSFPKLTSCLTPPS